MRRHGAFATRPVAVAVALGLMTGGMAVLTGCSADTRPQAIEHALMRAAKQVPYLIGYQAGDIAAALKEADRDATTVMVPLLVPDLDAVTAEVVAEPVLESNRQAQNSPSPSVDPTDGPDPSPAGEPSGETAPLPIPHQLVDPLNQTREVAYRVLAESPDSDNEPNSPSLSPQPGETDDPAPSQTGNTPAVFESTAEAAKALADSGQIAWEKWLEANLEVVEYYALMVPVRLSKDDNGEHVVKVDQAALDEMAEPLAANNARLFTQTVEGMTQWRQALVFARASNYFAEITGLPDQAKNLANLQSVTAVDAGTFTIDVAFVDPQVVVDYQTAQALDSFGTGSIWGGVDRKAFEAKQIAVTRIPDLSGSIEHTSATVTVEVTGTGEYATWQSPQANLLWQVDRFLVKLEPGSFPAPFDAAAARSAAADTAMKELDARTIKEVERPDTGSLTTSGTGQSVTIVTGSGGDKHVTFFAWDTDKQVVSAFIRSGETLTIRVPIGSYRLVFATGSTWYGDLHSFGPNGDYREFKTDNSAAGPLQVDIQSNYTYTISISVADVNNDQSIPSGPTDNPFEQ